MKFICSKEILINGINIVQKAVSAKTSLPILEGILINAKDKIFLTGNDLEIGIEYELEGSIEKTGSIVVNAKVFGDIIRKLPNAKISFEVIDEDKININCEKIHFEIKGMNPDNFPGLQSIVKDKPFIINQILLKDMIRKTIFAVSIDENRPVLTGSLIECNDDEIIMVSIDGFRLALRKEIMDINNIQKINKVVIPGKTLADVQKIISDENEDIKIYTTKNQILFEMRNCKVVSRLLEGEYLNYKGIIPVENETVVTIDKRELIASLERATLVIPSDDRRYPVIFKIKDDRIKITAKTEVGMVEEEIIVEMLGKELEIGFNPRYFIEALRAIDDEIIKINFTTEIGPCTINSISNDKYIYMLLPVRR